MYLKTANAEVRNYEMAPGNFEGEADKREKIQK